MFEVETDTRHTHLSQEEIERIMTLEIDDHKCESEDYQWTTWRSETTPPVDNTYDMELLEDHQKLFG